MDYISLPFTKPLVGGDQDTLIRANEQALESEAAEDEQARQKIDAGLLPPIDGIVKTALKPVAPLLTALKQVQASLADLEEASHELTSYAERYSRAGRRIEASELPDFRELIAGLVQKPERDRLPHRSWQPSAAGLSWMTEKNQLQAIEPLHNTPLTTWQPSISEQIKTLIESEAQRVRRSIFSAFELHDDSEPESPKGLAPLRRAFAERAEAIAGWREEYDAKAAAAAAERAAYALTPAGKQKAAAEALAAELRGAGVFFRESVSVYSDGSTKSWTPSSTGKPINANYPNELGTVARECFDRQLELLRLERFRYSRPAHDAEEMAARRAAEARSRDPAVRRRQSIARGY